MQNFSFVAHSSNELEKISPRQDCLSKQPAQDKDNAS